jgi:hypothetical protein
MSTILWDSIYNRDILYDTVSSYVEDGLLNLSDFLADLLNPPGNFNMNCYDFSHCLNVLVTSLGIPSYYRSDNTHLSRDIVLYPAYFTRGARQHVC